MSHGPSHGLQTCPDCGGILEPSRPGWIATIDVVALRPVAAPPDTSAWRCPLCGYHRVDPPARSESQPRLR